MKIKFIDIKNFRKLKKVRIEFSEHTTLFVGANNSGKTSVIALFKKFFNSENFYLRDVTLSSWKILDSIEEKMSKKKAVCKQDFKDFTITMDIWLSVGKDQIHYVSSLLPTLDWNGGDLGIRLAVEPKDIEKLQKDFKEAKEKAEKVLGCKGGEDIKIHPDNLADYLLDSFDCFGRNMYLLDPMNSFQIAQDIPPDQESIAFELLNKLIQVDVIDATRQVSDVDSKEKLEKRDILSFRATNYYKKHIESENQVCEEDVQAKVSAQRAEKAYNDQIEKGLAKTVEEIASFGYPGMTDAELVFSSKLPLANSFDHAGAVQYKIKSEDKECAEYRLPERCNGLGYQNLIDIIFQLIHTRDGWLKNKNDEEFIKPIHLVLIEEPEAHLHAQVQQVFIKQAYCLLTKHDSIKLNPNLSTQLIVSTHSSHIAYECDFSQIRYFKRKKTDSCNVIPTSEIVNMSDVFGNAEEQTRKFVERYIKAAHCDLFFADAVILIEGSAERILLPHFIRDSHRELNQCYISILEVGGSHAHRLKPLIEQLGVCCLVITDLDAKKDKKVPPERNAGQVTSNPTLVRWLGKKRIDELLDLEKEKRIMKTGAGCVFFCYQGEVECRGKFASQIIIPYTFEESLFIENCTTFENTGNLTGLAGKFLLNYKSKSTAAAWRQAMFESLKKNEDSKAEFALDVLCLLDPVQLQVPSYIEEGLNWLAEELHVSVLACQITDETPAKGDLANDK